MRKLLSFFRDEQGQDIIEYALLAAFISIVAVGIIKLIGPILITIFNKIVTALT